MYENNFEGITESIQKMAKVEFPLSVNGRLYEGFLAPPTERRAAPFARP